MSTEIIEFDYGTWDQVRHCWKHHLWPGRSEIKPIVGMTFDKGFDKEIEKSKTTFFVAKLNNHVIGVNSGFNTTLDYYRSRGLWVHEDWRKQGVATTLLKMTIKDAISKNNSHVWTIPRKNALSTYQKVGFKKVSEFTNEDMLYGPNCYALWSLK